MVPSKIPDQAIAFVLLRLESRAELVKTMVGHDNFKGKGWHHIVYVGCIYLYTRKTLNETGAFFARIYPIKLPKCW